MAVLTAAKYGKANVRLLKVDRAKDGTHTPYALNVTVLLEGGIDRSYTHADNTDIVATDSQKQTVYLLARTKPVSPPEQFGATIGSHFLTTYAHLTKVHVEIEISRWDRVASSGSSAHPHAFSAGPDERRTVSALISRPADGADLQIELRSGLANLKLLKTTGSSFTGFVRDKYTRLPETSDRVLATAVDASWTWASPEQPVLTSQVLSADRAAMYDSAFDAVRELTIDTFASHDSPSVQQTMYAMAERVLERVPQLVDVSYTLPNIHHFDIDLSWLDGLNNTDPSADCQVYAPQADPNGLIFCTVARHSRL